MILYKKFVTKIPAYIMPALVLVFAAMYSAPVYAYETSENLPMHQYAEVQEFINYLAKKHELDRNMLVEAFSESFDKSVVELMERPAEIKPWSYYSENLLSPERISGGKKYIKSYNKILTKTEQEYGVPANVIASVIGIESSYGAVGFKRTAIQSLATVAFCYPRRSTYFKAELENIFILAKKEKTNPITYRGSYAGAIGIPQFMPSNIIRYGKDGNGDGIVDIVNDHTDAIASVANYLLKHGWKKDKPTATLVKLSRQIDKEFFSESPCEHKKAKTVKELRSMGIIFNKKYSDDTKGILSQLDDGENKTEYVVFFENSCPIHKYNSSIKYTAAVALLAGMLAGR